MDWLKCCNSLIQPWHNEWVCTLFYSMFSVYLLVQLFLLLLEDKTYALNNDIDRALMITAVFGTWVSASCTVVYLTFYPSRTACTTCAFSITGASCLWYTASCSALLARSTRLTRTLGFICCLLMLYYWAPACSLPYTRRPSRGR